MKVIYLISLFILVSCVAPLKDFSWQEFSIEGNPSLRGISVLNKKVVWVSGTKGTVAKTEDGGATWEKVIVPDADSLDFRDVEVISEKVIILMSAGLDSLSNIFKTTDGGVTWKNVQANTLENGFYDGMDFWNEKEGILGGDPIDGKLYLLKTSDGGDTWQRIDPNSLPSMKEGEFGGFAASGSHLTVHGNSVWVGSGAAVSRVFYSNDRGNNWQVVNTPIIQGKGSQGIFSIDFFDDLNGLAVGGDYTKEAEGEFNVIITEDGGKTWQFSKDFPVYQSSVRYVMKYVALSVGPEASYFSRDQGLTWNKLAGKGYHTLSIGKEGTIWAAGRDGRIGHFEQK